MRTILVVDDSAVDRRLVGGVLEKESHWKVEYAENGRAALERISEVAAEVVVTDLNMPDLDGLELVKRLRRSHPQVPVILVTAFGSEYLAAEALHRGAANYVPKSQVAQRLVHTVREVLSLLRVRQNYRNLVESMDRTEFSFTLPNDPSLIDPLVDLIQRTLGGMHLCDPASLTQVGVAVREALWNALLHGNLELGTEELQGARSSRTNSRGFTALERRRAESPYCDRKIRVHASIARHEAKFVIRDEGPGFELTAVPNPMSPGAVESPRGRGLSLMRSFMDSVVYNQRGNEVTMTKRRDPETSGPDAAGFEPGLFGGEPPPGV